MQIAFLMTFLATGIVHSLPSQSGGQLSARNPPPYTYQVYPKPQYHIDVQTASLALLMVLRNIGYQGREPTDPVPAEGWSSKAIVMFKFENQPDEEPLEFQNVEATITAMRDFYHTKNEPSGVDVEVWHGPVLMGKATLRPDYDLSLGGILLCTQQSDELWLVFAQ